MKNGNLLIPALTLAVVSSLSLAAQQPANSPSPDMPQPSATQPAMPQQTAPGQQGTAPTDAVPGTANAPEATNADLRPVIGELVSKLDTKNAKAGDAVVVKTTEKAAFADGVVIPKGSKITGHVTDVQAHDESNPNSKIAIQFDQAELKGGQTMPIKSVLQSVAPASGSDGAQAAGPYGSGAAPSAPTGAPSSGSMAGGSGGSSATSSPSMNTQAPTQGSAAATYPRAGSEVGGPAAGTIVAHQGNIDIKTTGIPGVLIAANSNGQPFSNASGALLGAKQNVHLDGVTQFTLAIADVNNHASNR
jgi:hypothetical protein